MSLAKKRRASARPKRELDRAKLDANPHTRRARHEGRPWTNDGRSALVPEAFRFKTSGHVAGGSMFGGP